MSLQQPPPVQRVVLAAALAEKRVDSRQAQKWSSRQCQSRLPYQIQYFRRDRLLKLWESGGRIPKLLTKLFSDRPEVYNQHNLDEVAEKTPVLAVDKTLSTHYFVEDNRYNDQYHIGIYSPELHLH